ncbi:hypothetical protein NTGBS_790025 [Candidatus Nitrotoga sp. BS]|nr:hypothetical protein NTGBS_790025 [Candidatus Nitrotoga sp. BS]
MAQRILRRLTNWFTREDCMVLRFGSLHGINSAQGVVGANRLRRSTSQADLNMSSWHSLKFWLAEIYLRNHQFFRSF